MISLTKSLSFDDAEKIIFGQPFTIAAPVQAEISAGFDFLKAFAADKVIYGINTGFGPMAQYRVDDNSLRALQYNIIRSHSTGAGQPLPDIYVRAAMLARLCTFAQGKSGVHLGLVQLLAEFINHGICPLVPEHGSVGASGDLVQLAHIALALIGEGKVHYQNEWRGAADVLAQLGLQPFTIHLREGLAVTNGTSVMTGIGIVNTARARKLCEHAITASVLMNEIAESYDDFMSEPLNAVRRHAGQQAVASLMRSQAEGSQRLRKREVELYDAGAKQTAVFTHKVQPYYSLRCVPQVLGPVLDTVAEAGCILTDELNSASDNPIVDPETQNVYHGGNFHGDYVSVEMDKLKIAVVKLAMLAERQLNYLFHDRINGILPPFVNLGVLGLNYGLQAAQFTATSTTAECQTLANPMSVHSIPNNNDNQDVVSMGTNSALMAARVIDNAFQVLAIHYMALAQAVEALGIADRLAPATRSAYESVRAIFPAYVEDAPLYGWIEEVKRWLENGK